MLKLPFIFCLLFLIVPGKKCSAQSETNGFFVVLDKKKDCKNPFKSLTVNMPLCLSQKAIITEAELESVSQVYADSSRLTKYLNLRISKEAYNRLQLLGKKLPKTSLALVVNNTIVGVIENLQAIGNPIPIYGPLYSTDIEWVHKNLSVLKKPDKR